ncbi:hypothetical protein ACHQM5_014913 [Ranunculus cassubicifolius]
MSFSYFSCLLLKSIILLLITSKSESSSGTSYWCSFPVNKMGRAEAPSCIVYIIPLLWFLAGILLVAIGIFHLQAAHKVVEIVKEYDTVCIPPGFRGRPIEFIQDSYSNKTCSIVFQIPKQMKAPVYVYYQLDNYHQNHKRYATSKSERQLFGEKKNTHGCKPEKEIKDYPIVPCGLIAWSLFNDTYQFYLNDMLLDVNTKNISWKSDREKRFGSTIFPQNFQSGGKVGGATLDPHKPLSEQEALMVWMRLAPLPTFRKIFGRIETDLEPESKITVVIQNNYNTYSFKGKKKLVLSTATWIGGKNYFLGAAYVVVGGVCCILGIVFGIMIFLVKPRPLGDPAYFSWNKNAAGHSD